MPQRLPRTPLRRSPLALVVIGAMLSVQCGADGVDAPPTSPRQGIAGQCHGIEDYMPAFFEVLRDPSRPLDGLREVVVELSGSDDGLGRNPVGVLLDTAVKGLLSFAEDPWEAPDVRCLPNPPAQSENRLCAVRRALDFGVRDQGAADAIDELVPLLVKVLGYVTNKGPGAVGRENYEIIDLFNRTSRAEALCSPANLLDVLDGLVLFLRPTPECFRPEGTCRTFESLSVLDSLVSDPALQDFLAAFESSQSDGKGRAGIQALGRILLQAVADIPRDEWTYFDQVDDLIGRLLLPFLRSSERYAGLEDTVLDAVDLLRDLLHPTRENAFLAQLSDVSRCVVQVDTGNELVGVLYDLLSRPAQGGNADGLDLAELVEVIDRLVRLDRDGVLFGAIHTILSSTRADPLAMDAVRIFLVEVLTVDNARRLLPALQVMLERGVVTELVVVLDNLLYGCRAH